MFDFDDLDDLDEVAEIGGGPTSEAEASPITPPSSGAPSSKAPAVELETKLASSPQSPAAEPKKEDPPKLAEPEKNPLKLYSRKEIETLIDTRFKYFTRLPCAECGKAACKRFSDGMPMIVKTMVDAFWCKDCGRLLCEQHRDCHTCEEMDAEKEARAAMAPEKIREQLEQERRQKAAAEEAAKVPMREATKAADERRHRRYTVAEKAGHVTNYFQMAARDERAEERVAKEVLDLYEKSNRLSTFLWNEYEQPTLPSWAEDEWAELKKVYARGVEILGVVVAVPKNGDYDSGEWEELDMTNPWEHSAPARPPPRQEEPARPTPIPIPTPAAAEPSPASSSSSSAAPSRPLLASARPEQPRPAAPEGFRPRLGTAGRSTTTPLVNFPGRTGAGPSVPTLVSRPGTVSSHPNRPGTAGMSFFSGGLGGLSARGRGGGMPGRGGGMPGNIPIAGGKGTAGKGGTSSTQQTLGVLNNRGGVLGRGFGKGGGRFGPGGPQR